MRCSPMAYKALYRTYRPKDFDEVAGQEHITKTFKNALVNNKLSHAYLFSGPRGTGKTSVAKIIAKAVNCEQAPVSNPCNTCDICQGIDKNNIHDVVEIDAASNNGVDEIREIRDKVKYLPGVGKYKVYIIDEVHMLSTGAFNALLKTLEEPPKHVIFILATTEPHKIPSTIHSRCQRFDFRGISKQDMVTHLNEIIDKEAIAIEPEAVDLICEAAEGGMRDAISLLDQVVSYTKEKITLTDIHAIRGSVSHEHMLAIAHALWHEDVIKALTTLDKLMDEGKEAHNIVNDLIGFYRDILLYKNTENLLDKSLFALEKFQSLTSKLSNPLLFHYMDILSETKQSMRFSQKGKLYLELAFIKMVDQSLKDEVREKEHYKALEQTVGELTGKIEALENDILLLSQNEQDSLKPKEEPKSHKEKSQVDAVFDDLEKDSDSDEDASSETNGEKAEKTEDDDEDMDTSVKPEKPSDDTLAHYEYLFKKFSEKKYKTFDIKYVEDVLNSADREIKIDMVKKWFDIERYVDTDNLQYAKMITDGKLVATNGTMIIVTYETPTICNRLMKPQVKSQLLEILEAYFERQMMFLALPEEVWQKISKEFIDKFRKRQDEKAKITLSPIEHPRLIEIPDTEENYDDVSNESLKEAQNLFGDVVKAKKGESS